jgi:NhaC family Na+:H+ antiporter
MRKLVDTTKGLILTTIGSCLLLNFLTASQYVAIIVTGRMLVPGYKEKKLLPRNLSRVLEDAGTLTSPLVPWGLCGVFFTGVLGVPTVKYIPYTFLSLAVPIISAIYGITGFSIKYEGDIEGARTYSGNEEEIGAKA